MTGAFDRLRAWLGSVFGGGAAESDDGADVDTDAGDPTPRVVHRDDRPLETPGTMDRTTPPTASETDSADERSVDIPDAEAGAASGATASTTNPDTVSIPDAEADASTGDDPSAVDGRVAAEAEEVTAREPGDAADSMADDRSRAAADEDAAFACSVCGTAVDDQSEPCPLCRSTDVVPVSEGADDAAAPTRGGRTTVSTADDDDEAVDRLRDVTDEG